MARKEKATASQVGISASEVMKRIYTVRGYQVMLDQDLAEIYNVEPRALKQAVRRNGERFPTDFVFEPTKDELKSLRSQFVISNVENYSELVPRPCLRSQIVISKLESKCSGRGGNRYSPFAFTEQGVAMLSTVLNSQRAIQVNIGIMRIFVQLGKELRGHQPDLTTNLESLENMFRQRFDRLEAQIQNQSPRTPSFAPRDPIRVIQDAVARRFGLKVEDLKSAVRTKAISLPRQIAIYLVREHLCMGFTDIGQHFGRRDHTTILHAYRKIRAVCEANTLIQRSIDSLRNEIQPVVV